MNLLYRQTGKSATHHANNTHLNLASPSSPQEFQARLHNIATVRSGIPPALWEANVTLLENFEIESDGTVIHPLYDALGWHFARFSYRANDRSKELGVALTDHRGDVWQIILPDDSPRGYTYLAPKGIGNRAWFPYLDEKTIGKICDRHGITDRPSPQDAWEFFKGLQIPLVVTEGAKKCLAALGQGILACSVYGNSCLKSPDLDGWKIIHVAMDQDTGLTRKGECKATKTRKAVLAGAKYLRSRGADVSFIVWSPRDGKGLDDLLVNAPAKFWEAIDNPVKPHDRLVKRILGENKPGLDLSTATTLELAVTLPKHEILHISGPTGNGKTELMGKVRSHRPDHGFHASFPNRALAASACKRLDVAYINESKSGGIDHQTGCVINSVGKIKPVGPYDVFLDVLPSR